MLDCNSGSETRKGCLLARGLKMSEIVEQSKETAVAQTKLAEVEQLSAKLAAAEGQLEKGYAKLAFLLKEVSEHRYWKGTYNTFGEFLEHLQEKFSLGKSQLYNYLSTAKQLQDQVSEEDLNKMGISKALVLRDLHESSGQSIPETVVQQAVDPKVTIGDLKKLLYDSGQLEKPEDGEWFNLDFSGYYTEEEMETLRDAANAARHTDPPISQKLSSHVQRKIIAVRWAQNFLETFGADVVEGAESL